MTTKTGFQELVDAIVEGEGEDAVDIVERAIEDGVPATEIIEKGLVIGMKIVSDKYDSKEYFVPDLAASADAMSEALDILNPLLKESGGEIKGTIVLGVVQDCSQEIGKNIVAATLSGAGFSVHDMGINITPREFVDKAKEVKADIIAMGSPMLQTVKYFKDVNDILIEEGIRDKIKLLIGGASTNEETVAFVDVDAWGKDAADAVAKSLQLMEALNK